MNNYVILEIALLANILLLHQNFTSLLIQWGPQSSYMTVSISKMLEKTYLRVWLNEYTLWFPSVSKNLLSQENSLIGLQIRYFPFCNAIVHVYINDGGSQIFGLHFAYTIWWWKLWQREWTPNFTTRFDWNVNIKSSIIPRTLRCYRFWKRRLSFFIKEVRLSHSNVSLKAEQTSINIC